MKEKRQENKRQQLFANVFLGSILAMQGRPTASRGAWTPINTGFSLCFTERLLESVYNEFIYLPKWPTLAISCSTNPSDAPIACELPTSARENGWEDNTRSVFNKKNNVIKNQTSYHSLTSFSNSSINAIRSLVDYLLLVASRPIDKRLDFFPHQALIMLSNASCIFFTSAFKLGFRMQLAEHAIPFFLEAR